MPEAAPIGVVRLTSISKASEAMGAEMLQTVWLYWKQKQTVLEETHLYDFPSVGATLCNIMMAATLLMESLRLKMQLGNLEIVDLALFAGITKWGLMSWVQELRLTIVGVESLRGKTTMLCKTASKLEIFMIGAAMTGGDVLIEDAIWEHNRPLLSKMQEMGATVTEEEKWYSINRDISKLRPVTVKTPSVSRAPNRICRLNSLP